MAAINGNIITVTGVEENLVEEDLPKGTVLRVVSKSCSAGSQLTLKNKAGTTLWQSFAEGENLWRDQLVLPCDVRGGFTVPTFGAVAGTLIIIRPSGRL